MTRKRTALIAAAAVIACSGGLTEVCTAIGCLGTLTIVPSVAATGSYHIELVSVTDGQRIYDCTDASGACAVAKFDGFTPDRLIVTITNARGSRQYNVAPVYDNTYANGPRCGVTCRSATVTVAFP